MGNKNSKPSNPTPTPNPNDAEPPKPGDTLRTDGPTIEEYVAAGYDPKNYPPEGYAERETYALLYFREHGVLGELTPAPSGPPEGGTTNAPSPAPAAPALLDEKGELTRTGAEFVTLKLTEAVAAIGQGLRVIRANGHDRSLGQEFLGTTENAFEAARNAARKQTPAIADLAAAAQAQGVLVDVLANHSLQDGGDLTQARQAARRLQAALQLLGR